jgi:hypothetical protein
MPEPSPARPAADIVSAIENSKYQANITLDPATEKFSQERLCLLTCLLMGDPALCGNHDAESMQGKCVARVI